MGRLDQAKGAIMEAEVLDEDNPNVWVQVCGIILFSTVNGKDAEQSPVRPLPSRNRGP